MEFYFKIVVFSVLTGVFSLIVKKHSPEISFLISVAVVLVCCTTANGIVSQLKTHIQSYKIFSYFPQDIFLPLLKCTAISVITQISVSLCKDAGQSALASGIEFTGSIALVLCMMPLLDMLFQLIGGII